MNKFLRAYSSDRYDRILDLILHVLCGLALPGHWWYAFTPDIFVVPLWCHGVWTGKLLPSTNLLLHVHKALHSLNAMIIMSCLSMVSAIIMLVRKDIFMFGVVCFAGQYCIHVFIDKLTHEKWKVYERKR